MMMIDSTIILTNSTSENQVLASQTDLYSQPEIPQLILCQPSRKELYDLRTAYNISYALNFNDISTLNFSVPITIDGTYSDGGESPLPYYDEIKTRMLIHVLDIGWFIIKKVTIDNDGIVETKHVECDSYESVLANKNVVLLEGTYKFYDPVNPKDTLMYVILQQIKGWSIESVDSTLWEKYRTFKVSQQSVYNFLMNDVAQAYECIFIFNNDTKSITVKSFANVGKQTNIFLSYDNLVKNMSITEDSSEINTCLSCVGSNDLTISRVNPNGTMRIYNYDYYMSFMSTNLYNRYVAYKALYNQKQPIYADLISSYNNWNLAYDTAFNEKIDLLSQLAVLTEQQAVKIQTGQDLTSINISITAKKAEIDAKRAEITTIEGTIQTIVNDLDAINNLLNPNNYYSSGELDELETMTIEGTYQDESFLITDTMTEAEKQQQAQLLFNQSVAVLQRVSQPRINIEIDVVDFLKLAEYKVYADQLKVGDLITVYYNENVFYEVRLLSIENDWSTSGGLSLKFGNRYKLNEASFTLQDLLTNSINQSNTVSFGKYSFADWTTNYKDEVTTFITSALDASKNNIVSNNNQDITITSSGIRCRQKNGSNYNPNELWIVNNMLAFSTDNFATAKMAIGQINDSTYGNVYGIVADALVGKMIAGNKLTITNSNNKFTVDGTGATLVDASFTVTNSTNKSKIIIDPTNGFKIQKNTGSWVDVLYADTNGNLTFSGALNGASGTFSGDITIGSGNSVFKADSNGIYLGNPTFASAPFRVSPSGALTATNATLSGNITMTGGSISWANVNSDPTIAGAISTANGASSTAGTALSVAQQIANGTYSGGTFINGSVIYSPTISAGTITGSTLQTNTSGDRIVIDSTGFKSLSSLGLNGVQISNDGYANVEVYRNGTKIGYMGYAPSFFEIRQYNYNMKIGNPSLSVYPQGTWDFSSATVTGLTGVPVTAVFG